MNCFYFGCWNEAGHYLWGSRGARVPREFWHLDWYKGRAQHLDSTLAPRRRKYTSELCWKGEAPDNIQGERIGYDSKECPQGEFLIHHLDTGYTAMSWWDRCQGDTRSNCNSTVLLEGTHTADEMLAALREHFPSVAANLEKAGVVMVNVTPEAA